MNNGLTHVNDIDLRSVKITSSSGQTMEMRDAIVEISYFEDIFALRL